MSALKPAHEVIVNKVLAITKSMRDVDPIIEKKKLDPSYGTSVPVSGLEDMRRIWLRELLVLLELLPQMIIPADNLKKVIEQITEVAAVHPKAREVLTELEKRQIQDKVTV